MVEYMKTVNTVYVYFKNHIMKLKENIFTLLINMKVDSKITDSN